MCGIAGYIYLDKDKLADFSVVKRMTDSIIHRGPDAEGFYVKNNVALGHRRLSIIDLNTGDQPMYNDNKTLALIFNGEIYNYIELREELKGFGFKFRTTSDTEVIIKAYEKWGVDCQSKFNGCWAIAIWDESKQQLFLSRDRVGEKPLYYTCFEDAIVFASEIKSLFAYGIPRSPNIELIEMYLVLTNIPAPFTFYKGIQNLRPGHFLILKNKQLTEHKFWDLPEISEQNMVSESSYIYEKFTRLLTDSVRIRMRSDVPYGAFLSGGLDSSSIVALMSDYTSQPVETFTIGFKEKAFDESKLAQEVADKFKTNHHNHTVIPLDFNAALKKIAHHYDDPFGDSSAIPTGIVSKHARKYVKMVLTGDGGDELLSGYPTYLGLKYSVFLKKMPSFIRSSIPVAAGLFANFFKGNTRYLLNRGINFVHASNLPFEKWILSKSCWADLDLIKNLIPDSNKVFPIEDYFSDLMKGCTYKDDFYKLMFVHFKHDLPDDFLVKVDRMSLAYSLEARIPFLDHRLIEFMVNVDKNVKIQKKEQKSVLRQTIGKRLPESLLNAPKKGFSVPLREWFKDQNDITGLSTLTSQDFGLNSATIKKVIDQNSSGNQDLGNFIWQLFVLKEIMQKDV
jgi:asparagine synthase (glutamine-hydrolysing)